MKEKKRAELLAPAGSFASLKAAVAAGADAVYMGGARFGARAYAQNADQDEMIAAIEYAHLHGCRLYMTVNTLFKENELGELYEYLLPYYKAGLDGVIVQDLGAEDKEECIAYGMSTSPNRLIWGDYETTEPLKFTDYITIPYYLILSKN